MQRTPKDKLLWRRSGSTKGSIIPYALDCGIWIVIIVMIIAFFDIQFQLDRCFQKIGAVRNWSDFSKGYHMPEDSELVQALLTVYRKRTGDMAPPKQLGAGTYARHLKNTVAFGPERSNRVNRIHMADEAVPVDDLLEDTKMIADAIIALACRA